ncbi:SNF2-related protein [Salisediminibacterium selenitireducens]|uniref:SNF2-related protein n=1 Tax=Bacillus selenitireducens (strain ATCC 700615 / DSM 15326 / MLS10) TaxID=439292 RepID=D6XYZ6_BACIE|nr:DEAD/DEAH box helicase [Salisediminibacterium selenitireducens]ADH98304.1 SNF2-related protein [[Bacillus] selenitireducens MLS10]
MKFTAHDYQQYAIDFICQQRIASLILDMGLGKTVITLTALFDLLLDSFHVRKVLVVAPLRVGRDVWPEELDKWDHLEPLRYEVAIGNPEERLAALHRSAPITIINRENITWLIEKSGYPFDFDMVVIDELSSFKSHQSKRFKSMMKVRSKVTRIVGLTGTPSSNGLMDLWAEYRLLDKGERLGRFISHYRDAFFEPDKRNQQVIFTYKLKPGAEEQIYERIQDITISMKGSDHLSLPPLIVNERHVQLSEKEMARIEAIKRDLIITVEGEDITASNAAALSGKLLQMANGAVYDDQGQPIAIHERKLDALEDMVEAANGKPVLIAYWFKHDLDRIQAWIEATVLSNAASIQQWNEGRIQVGLIHPASAGHGLNLQFGGSTLIWFGLTWSLELYQQTNARLYRQGQTESVAIHHLIGKGTLDERVMKALKKKDVSQTAFIDAVKAELQLYEEEKTHENQ